MEEDAATSRNVILHGGVNTIRGDVYILEVHGGVINLYGRAGAINQFGGVMNDKRSQSSCQGTDPRQNSAKVPSPGTTTKIVYRDRVVYRDKIVYRDREVSEDILVEKITRLENQFESEREQHRKEVELLKERLQGALDAYHGLLHQQKQEPIPDRSWEYKPTRAECEAVLKNLKVWMECEQELEPINL